MGQPRGSARVAGGGRGDVTRRALVDAALTLFEERGVEGTSVDEITAHAHVAKGTFYVHFQRKQDVLLEWAAQVMVQLDVDGLPPTAPDALRELGQRVAGAMAAGHRSLTGRMVREIVAGAEDWVRVVDGRPTLWAHITPIVERGQRAGELRTDQSARRLSMALTILWLDSVVGWGERGRSRPLDQAIGMATDLFLGGAVVRG